MPSTHYLPPGLPAPVPEPDGLDAPYWQGTRQNELRIQRCRDCRTWLWGPEWICHQCLSFDLEWQRVDGRGLIYSWERAWHPVHPALKGHPPYIVALVELVFRLNEVVYAPFYALCLVGPSALLIEMWLDARRAKMTA